MKIRIEKFAAAYIRRPWLPLLVFLCLLAASSGLSLLRSKCGAVSANVLTVAALASFVGLPLAGIFNLVRRQWKTGLLHLLAMPVGVVAVAGAMFFMMMYSMMGPSDDGFADSLVIPPDLVVAEPLDRPEAQPGMDDDSFQRALLDALTRPGGDDPSIVASCPALAQLRQRHPDLLARYLRCSSAWRVFTEDENLFATRRWIVGSERQYTLHGYYTRHNLDMFHNSNVPEFQSRTTLGLSGKPWWRGNADTTWLQASDSAPVRLSAGNQMHESHCVVSVGDMAVEIFEQSQTKERRLTKAALAQIEAELAPLAAQPTEETLRALLPADAIRAGSPSLDLRNSFQTGIYNAHIWINPGEPGMLYLKAYEVTQGTPLSVDRLKERANEWVGWSAHPEELFLSNTHFTIYEGDWGKPYAARFEVWFAPDSGAPERKLLERIFKIEGWQR
ncbi:MAG: hypothetical protein AB7V14_06545 [Kiritimatiellia bacterium]